MKLFLRTFMLVLLVVGCQKVDKPKKPKNLIPEDQMVDILVDLAKIDAAISINGIEYQNRGADTKELLFEKYQIDSAQLVRSNAYYTQKFKVNQSLYERVYDRLKEESDSLVKQEEREKNKKREEAEE